MFLFVHIKTIDFVTHSCVLKKIFFFAASYYSQVKVPSLKGPLYASKNLMRKDLKLKDKYPIKYSKVL